MKLRLICLLSFCFLFAAACVQTQPQIPRWTYSGLDRNSYGKLRIIVNERTQLPVSPPLCDGSKHGRGVDDLSRVLTGTILGPLSKFCKIDETLIKEELQGHFKMPSDVDNPTVSILDRSENHIVFWYSGGLVSLNEVTKAANDYCSRMNKTAIYEGSARKCKSQKMSVKVNGKSSTHITYIISSFQCSGQEVEELISQEPVTVKSHTELIREIQGELIRLKYLPGGSANGKIGPKTKSAIKKFQSSCQMSTDGLPTESLLTILKSY